MTQSRPHDDGPLTCPRCGLSIWPRATWLTVRHCPRCLARAQQAIELSASLEPRPAPDARSPAEPG